MLSLAPGAVAFQNAAGELDPLVWTARGQRDLDRFYFSAAEQSLSKAVRLDPKSATAHRLLARALLGQLPPNLHLFPDSQGLLPKADAEATKATELDPSDASSWCALGIVKHKLADLSRDGRVAAAHQNEAYEAFHRALANNPKSFEAHYELANMTMESVGVALLAARTQSGVSFGQPGRIRDDTIRYKMQAQYKTAVEDALSHSQEALAIDPSSASAMSEMSALLRLRSLLQDTEEDFRSDILAAEEWMRKADAARLAVAKTTPPSAPNLSGGILGGIIGAAPPPTSVLSPVGAHKQLIKRVDPDYPPAAKDALVQGDVKFAATISEQGLVKKLQLLSGPPELVEAARRAAIQWEYSPLIVDGRSRKFLTTIEIHFVLPQ